MAYNPDTMSFDVPDTDTIYVSGLPPNITEQDIAEYFGSIGIIKIDKKTKKPKIWLYRDKATGALKGDGTVTYDDPFSASSAVQWFGNKDWKGSMLQVTLSQKKQAAGGYGGGYGGGGGGGYGGGGGGGYGAGPDMGGGGGGGFGGGGGGPGGGRPGDWPCGKCGNVNFAFRQKCHKCNTPRGTVDMRREGQGGGFKELDEQELEEARRRRKEREDQDMYDEFGRLKKHLRGSEADRKAREEAALARLRGEYNPAPSATERGGSSGRDERSGSRGDDRGRGDDRRDRRSRSRSRSRERGGDRERRERDDRGRGDRRY
ncbi:hypothetical protein GPECTOR_6g819 [Gonium pectorale]|uniref:RanBP2-type domain-containing protein n=1 Tax=Gonium pectorale TaxID=33097 RepID=A0A150GVN6_GONPE|nr:hypothetical protein GPECTOR_6g819 [Gonium pectorale]|eukprot:KXZ53901.1 hypothetical protein GPECTOR_6g819 [Gonium pectorale]